MAEMDKTNRGAIWKNQKKERDTHPDFTGSLNVNGVEFWVSAWKRKEDASDKAPALSFSIKPKEDRAAPPARNSYADAKGRAPARNDDMQDDIPF
ncbi:MAG: hypothetical protein V4602_15075 [Pseudomonadota bacterium]